MSKRVKEWNRERIKLKKIYEEKEIEACELRLEGCLKDNFLQFVHKHKRIWYYDKPGLLGSFQETLLGCQNCHDIVENNKELTEEIFNKLRG